MLLNAFSLVGFVLAMTEPRTWICLIFWAGRVSGASPGVAVRISSLSVAGPLPRSPAVFGVLHLQLVASVALKSSATPWQKHGKYRHQGSSPPAQGMAHEFMEANATIGRNNPAIPLPTKSNAQISLVSF